MFQLGYFLYYLAVTNITRMLFENIGCLQACCLPVFKFNSYPLYQRFDCYITILNYNLLGIDSRAAAQFAAA